MLRKQNEYRLLLPITSATNAPPICLAMGNRATWNSAHIHRSTTKKLVFPRTLYTLPLNTNM